MKNFEYINEFADPRTAKKVAAQLRTTNANTITAAARERAEALFEKALDAEHRGAAFVAKCFLNDAIAVLEGRR